MKSPDLKRHILSSPSKLRILSLLWGLTTAASGLAIATTKGGGIIDDVPGGLPLLLHSDQIKWTMGDVNDKLLDDDVATTWTSQHEPNLATSTETLPAKIWISGVGNVDCGFIQANLNQTCKAATTLAVKMVNGNNAELHITKVRILTSSDENTWNSGTILKNDIIINLPIGGIYDGGIASNADGNGRVSCFSFQVPVGTRAIRIYPMEVSGMKTATRPDNFDQNITYHNGNFSLSELQVYEMLKPGEAGVRSLVLPDKNSAGNVIQVSVPYGEVYVNDNKINGHSNNVQYLANATTNLPTEKISVSGMGNMEFAHIKIDLNGTYSNVPIVIKKENRSDNSRGNFTKVRILTSDQESINGTWTDQGIFGPIVYDQAGNIVLDDNINPKDGLVSTYTFTPTEATRYIRMYPIEVAGMKKGQYNLIGGGDAESGPTASVIQQFDYANNTEIPASVIDESGNHYFKIPITANPAYVWSSQMLIVLDENIYLGDKVKLSFRYKCDDNRTIQLQTHTTQGAYCGGIDNNIQATTTWQEFSSEFDVTNSITNIGWFKHLALNLSTNAVASNFYIDDIKFEIVGLAEIRGGNAESGESENIKGETNGSNNMTVDYDHVFKTEVFDKGEGGGSWDTQFFIKWDSDKLIDEDKVRFSFRYRSEDESPDPRNVVIWYFYQNSNNERTTSYTGPLKQIEPAFTEWQNYESIVNCSDLKANGYIIDQISLGLATKENGTNFYLDDIRIEKLTTGSDGKVTSTSLIPHGDAEISDIEAFDYVYLEDKEFWTKGRKKPMLVPDPLHKSKVFRFSIPSKADAPNSWTSQAYIMPTIPFEQGQLTLSFDYRCEDARTISVNRHGKGGDYKQQIGSLIGFNSLEVKPMWDHKDVTLEINAETDANNIFNAISFWLSSGTYASNFYLDNVTLDYNPKRTIIPTTERFLIDGGDAESGKTDQVIAQNGQALEIDPPVNKMFSRDIAENSNLNEPWRTQLFIKSDRTLKEGDKVTLSFRYKCDDNRNISLSAQGVIGDYHAYIYYNDENNNSQRLKAATTEWQTYSTEFTVSAEQAGDSVENKTYSSDRHSESDGFNYVAIDLASAGNASKFYIDDIVFKAGDDSAHPDTYRRDFKFGDLKVFAVDGHSAAGSLIINENQLTTNGKITKTTTRWDGTKFEAVEINGVNHRSLTSLLLDGQPYNYSNPDIFNTYESDTETDRTKHYLQVDLNGSVYSGDRLTLLIRRDFHDTQAIPVKFKVEGCEDVSVTETSVWTTSAFIDMPYSGKDDELKWQSVSFAGGGVFRHLRFTPVLWYDGNAGTTTNADNAGIALAEFRLYIEDSQKSFDNILDNALTGDVKYAFMPVYGRETTVDRATNANFNHTLGIIDAHNHRKLALREWCDWDKWNDDGSWQYASSTPDQYKKMPDYRYLSGVVEVDGKEVTLEGNRQQAPTLVHDVYVKPGEYVHLRPFSDIRTNGGLNYVQKYVRWYDFKTDRKCDNLIFPMDYIQTVDDFHTYQYEYIIPHQSGHFAGISFPSIQYAQKRGWGYNSAELIGSMATYHAPSEPTVEEKWIAVDFAQEASMRPGMNYEINLNGNDDIYEPTLAFRHIFHIMDAKTFAEKFGKDAETNKKYIAAHRREVTARAGEDFQMRLDGTPSYSKAIGQKPYMNGGTVEFVHSFVIKTYNTDGTPYPEKDEKGIFYIPENTQFDDLKYTLYDIDPKVEHEAYTYARGFVCDKVDAKSGIYIVRLEGLDEDGKAITLGGGAPLILQEYEVTFVGPDKASLLIESSSERDHGDPNVKDAAYSKQTNEYLEKVHGGKAIGVNFDDYVNMAKVSNSQGIDLNNYFTNDYIMTDYGDKFMLENPDKVMNRINTNSDMGRLRFKWPLPWNQTNYAFQYAHTFDYNVYSITNNVGLAPYHNGANETQNWYDRMHSEGDNEYGFMFYVNAAADPGEIASIPIGNRLCPGTTLYVTGWMNEMTGGKFMGSAERDKLDENGNIVYQKDKDGNELKDNDGNPMPEKETYDTNYQLNNDNPEAANLIVSFKAINEDGTEQTLHSFVTGPVEKRGYWYKFYYSLSIDPSSIKSTGVKEYRVVFENNAMSSKGADYCVDDLRVYVTKPTVYARQTTPLCNTDQTTVMIEVPFESMLTSLGVDEVTGDDAGKDMTFYFSLLDKDEYEKANPKNYYQNAFKTAVVKYNYDGGNNHEQYFGKVTFSSNFLKNTASEDSKFSTSAWNYPDENGQRWLRFNTSPNGDKIKEGKDYIIALYPASKGTSFNENGELTENGEVKKTDGQSTYLWQIYDLESDCAVKSNITVQGSGVIRVDGISEDDLGEMTVCKWQTPVIQVDMKTYDKDKKPLDTVKNVAYDWYLGPITSKKAISSTGKDTSTEKGKGYVDQSYNGIKLADAMEAFRQVAANKTLKTLEDAETDYQFTSAMLACLKHFDDNGLLVFNEVSLVLPPVTEADGEDIFVTAIPIDNYSNDNIVFCPEPNEVHLKVSGISPQLNHGFDVKDFYPEKLDDVPLRIGLKQIESTYKDKDGKGGQCLVIPLRDIKTAATISKSIVKSDDVWLYLAATDDPNAWDDPDDGVASQSDDDTEIMMARAIALKTVGTVEEIVAVEKDRDPLVDNELLVRFDKDFKFREGYYYRLRFNFTEDGDYDGSLLGDCDGQHIFTIKIVPEYQKWTGGESRNWANDDNWERVTADMIHNDDADNAVKKVDEDKYTVSGSNTIRHSYAPLDFTKVIIPKATGEDGNLSVTPPFLYAKSSPIVKSKLSHKGKTFDVYDEPKTSESGNPTENIQYDMAAFQHTYGEKTDIHCRPWYTEDVDEIHFMAGAEMANQQHLAYNKAWAEIEVEPTMWHTLSSPLQQTYAGDLYLPTEKARQESMLFTDIYFDDTLQKNNRFKPAVFQMLWNHRGLAMVYKKEGGSESAAVFSTWSNVYNDAEDNYSEGKAFAINVDMEGVDNPAAKALFRLPKADTKYIYYDQNGETGTGGVTNTLDKTNYGKLNPTRNSDETDCKFIFHANANSRYFMIGNPFIGMMDMGAFLGYGNNSNVVNKKFWLLDGTKYISVEWDDNGITTNLQEDDSSPLARALRRGYIPPCTAVFLEAKEANNGSLYYNESMIVQGIEHLKADESQTRSSDWDRLYISAVRNGRSESVALLVQDNMADPEYNSEEDMMLLVDEELQPDMARVFTSASGMATSINMVPEGTTVGVGLLAPDAGETTLVFSGDCTGLLLLDTESNTLEPLFDGYELKVEGSTDGRYFINAGIAEYPEDAIKVMTEGHKLMVLAPGEGEMKVSVYDVSGITVVSDITDEPEWETILNDSVYVVEVVKNGCRVVRKIIVR